MSQAADCHCDHRPFVSRPPRSRGTVPVRRDHRAHSSCPGLAIFWTRCSWIAASLWLISRVLRRLVLIVLPVFSLLYWRGGFLEVLTQLFLLTSFSDFLKTFFVEVSLIYNVVVSFWCTAQ